MTKFLFSYSHKVRDLSVVHPVSRPSGWTLCLLFILMLSFVQGAVDQVIVGNGESTGVIIEIPEAPVNFSQQTVNNSILWDGFAFDINRWLLIDGTNANSTIDIQGQTIITGDVDLNNNNIIDVNNINATTINATSMSANVGNFTTLYTSNGTLFVGNVSLSSFNETLQVQPGKLINASFLAGDGSQLFNLDFNVTNGSAAFSNITSGDFIGGNFTGDYFFGGNFIGENFTGNLSFFKKIRLGNITGEHDAFIDVEATLTNITEESCEGTVGCYRFEEGTGSVILDSSEFNNNGILRDVIYGASKGGNGTGNYSTFYDSSLPGYAYIPDSDEIKLINNFSISMWVRRNDSSDHTLLSKNNDVDGLSGYLLRVSTNGRIAFVTRDSGTYVRQRTAGSGSLPFDGLWHHVVATIDPIGTITLYVDSVDQGTAGTGVTMGPGSVALILGVGADLQTEPLFGSLDELGIFPGELNQTQIDDLFADGFNVVNLNVSRSNNDYIHVSESEEVHGDIFIINQFNKFGFNNPNPQFDFDFNGSAIVRDTLVVGNDIILQGSLIGGSPVKVLGGMEVLTGDFHVENGSVHLHNSTIEGASDIYADNVTANDFIDLTPAYPGTREEALVDITNTGYSLDTKGKKEVDHSSYSDFVTKINTKTGTVGRSIGAVVSTLQEAFKALLDRQNAQQTEINELKTALCSYHPGDPLCS